MFIKLPYIIRLDEEKDYKFQFQFEDFEMFCLEMRHNDDSDYDIYDENCSVNSCKNIRIEAIYKYCDYTKYKNHRIPYTNQDINEFTVELPPDEVRRIFNSVNKKLDEIINYLRKKTNMFWIEEIPVNLITYCFGREIEFNFYSPNARLSKVYRQTKKITNYYMESDFEGVKEVNDNIFDSFDANENYYNTADYYLNKSEKSLYERNYEEFIIYCSISVESFIKNYIEKIKPNKDIVYGKLASLRYDYIDKYYNVLLKYLKGKSLKELNEGAFTHLKNMYTLRNEIMHKGIIDKDALKNAGLSHLEYINFNECEKILKSIKKSFSLINDL